MKSLKNLMLATSFSLIMQGHADDPIKQKNGKTPAVCPSTCDLSTDGTYRVSVSGEFIYWKPLEGGTEFTFPTRTAAPIPGTTSPSYVPFKYEPGFRIGAKYCLPYNGWNTSFTALNLSSNVSTSLNGVLFPLQAAQSVIQNPISQFTSATSASANWKLNYWVFDYRLGCEHPFCENFLFNPYCGVKGAIIHQTFRYNYNNVSELTPATNNYEIATKNDCDNVGVQGGMRGEWVLWKGFRLVGDCSTALVYGWFDVHQTQSGQTGLANVINFTTEFQRLLPTVDLMVALSWGDFFNDNTMHFDFHVGYQAQYWWRQNQNPRFMDSGSPYYSLTSEDLGFQGLTLGGQFDF